MPVALTCICGRAMRVKDETAGKKIRCPACSTVLTVPKPETPKDAEEEALHLLLEDSDEPAPFSNRDDADDLLATDSIQPTRTAARPGPPPEPPPPEWKWKKKPSERAKPIRKPREKSGGGLFNNVNANYGVMGTGALMMLGSVGLGIVCFLVLVITGYIFPWLWIAVILLFFSGLGTVFKGLMGHTD